MILQVQYKDIVTIWKNDLWPERQSAIETHSAMLIDKTFDIKNFSYPATYFLYLFNNKIIGCNSGHMCADNSYRSRGLFVYPEYRGKGIGVKLLQATITQGQKENAKFVWSYPRQTSWHTYEKAGFKLTSDWEQSEMYINAYCTLHFS
jgi:GNAT superfamily N-acetyltransferase